MIRRLEILWRGWRKYPTLFLVSAIFFSAINCMIAYTSVTHWGRLPVFQFAEAIEFLFFGLCILAQPILLIGLVPRFCRKYFFGAWIVTMGFFTGTIIANRHLNWPVQREGIRQATYRLEPLVKAIHNYQMVHDRPPERLDQLIPAYLSAIPDPGLPNAQPLDYTAFAGSTGWELSIRFAGNFTYHQLTFYEKPKFARFNSGNHKWINGWLEESEAADFP